MGNRGEFRPNLGANMDSKATNIALLVAGIVIGSGAISSSARAQRGDWDTTQRPSATEVGLVPVGTVVPFAGTTVPEGWLACDGTEVDRVDYLRLYNVIGTAHGAGDGVDTFNLPDYRGRFLRGQDAGAGRDPDAASREAASAGGNAGDLVGSVQEDATSLPNAGLWTTIAGNHTHALSTNGTHTLTYDDVYWAEFDSSVALPGNRGLGPLGGTDFDNRG